MTTRRSRSTTSPIREESALVPASEGDARRDALIRAVGFDKLSEPQRELALAIAQRYELDPMLKHLVMIEGRPYITRDGLLHVAHRSNDFDGIEVSDPVLDETTDAQGRRFWRARASVWRKSFSRPFVYPGRYPAVGQNAKYAEEMAIKVAEVMTLRRAFDVSAPTIEERWDEEHEAVEQPAEPTSLAERAAAKAAAISGETSAESTTGAEATQSVDEDEDEVSVIPEQSESAAPDVEPETIVVDEPTVSVDEALEATGGFSAPTVGIGHQPLTPDEEPANPIALDAFAEWAKTRDPQMIRATARQMFPDLKQFSELTSGQIGRLQNAIEQAERAVVLSDDERAAIASATTGAEQPESAESASGDAEPVDAETAPYDASVTAALEQGSHPNPAASDAAPGALSLCGATSPLSDSTCTMDAGHKGPHRKGLKETW